jgi:hypothetical protein
MEALRETIWTDPTFLHERAVRVHLGELPPEKRPARLATGVAGTQHTSRYPAWPGIQDQD